MKKFLIRVFLFLVVNLALFSIAFFIKPDRLFHYRFLDDSCIAQAEKIYHRAYNSDEQIEWLFLGSSRTMHAVNDRWINDHIYPAEDSGQVSNMGYCRLGRDLHALFLRNVLQSKKPRNLLLEVRHSENLYSHPVFPYLATNEDLFDSNRPIHKHWLKNIFGAWRVRVDYGFSNFVQQAESVNSRDTGLYGYASTNVRGALEGIVPNLPSETKEMRRQMHSFPEYYLSKMVRSCEEFGITLIFLYIPNYRNQFLLPVFSEEYRAWGELWLPPVDLLSDPSYWMDEIHLNDQGAAIYSNWLVEQMVALNEQ